PLAALGEDNAVGLRLVQRADGLGAAFTLGLDVVGHVGRVVHGRFNVAGQQRHVHLRGGVVRLDVGIIAELVGQVVVAGRADLGRDTQSLEVIHILDRVVVGANHDAQTGLIIRNGEVDHLGTRIGNGGGGNGGIRGDGLQKRNDALERARVPVGVVYGPGGVLR